MNAPGATTRGLLVERTGLSRKCVFGILGEERRNLKRVTVILLRLYLTVIKKLLLVTFGCAQDSFDLITCDIGYSVSGAFSIRSLAQKPFRKSCATMPHGVDQWGLAIEHLVNPGSVPSQEFRRCKVIGIHEGEHAVVRGRPCA